MLVNYCAVPPRFRVLRMYINEGKSENEAREISEELRRGETFPD